MPVIGNSPGQPYRPNEGRAKKRKKTAPIVGGGDVHLHTAAPAVQHHNLAVARKAARQHYAAQRNAAHADLNRLSNSIPRVPTNAGQSQTARMLHEQQGQTRNVRRAFHHGDAAIHLRHAEQASHAARRIPLAPAHKQASGPHISALGVNIPLAGVVHAVKSAAGSVGPQLIGALTHTPPKSLPKFVAKESSRTGEDFVDITTNAIPALYAVGREAARGHVGSAAKQLAQPYVDLAKHPVKSFTEHPLSSYLLASGAYGAAGRGAGAALRAAPSGALKELGATSRRPGSSTVAGTALREQHYYSPNIISKGIQQARERRNPPETRPMTSTQIQRRVDETAAANEDIRRLHRSEILQRANMAVTGGRKFGHLGAHNTKPSAATSLVAQNIVSPSRHALVEYRTHLETEASKLEGSRLAQNRATRADIDRALKDFSPGEHEVAARRFSEVSRELQDELVKRGLVTREQTERASLLPYAVRHMGVHVDPASGEMKLGDSLVSPAVIRAHMRANGFTSEPAFVSHKPNMRGSKNFYVAQDQAPSVGGPMRTGQAVQQGTLDIHPATMVEQAAHSQGLIDAADGYKRFIDEFAVRGKSGDKPLGLPSYQRALEVAREHMLTKDGEPRPDAVQLRPVQITPFHARREQIASMMAGDPERLPATVNEALQEALSGKPGEGGRWALVPEAAAKRMMEHAHGSTSEAGMVGNVYGSLWRRNVLAFSPKWFTGNVVEAALRSMVSGSGLRSLHTGRAVLKQLKMVDPKAWEEARVRTIAGGHYSLAERNSIHTPAERFAGTHLAKLATGLGKFWRAPGPKQLADVYHAWTHLVFHTLNGNIESQFQTAMLGKAIRKSPLMSKHVVKLSQEAIDQAARGLRDTHTQIEFGRAVDRMYGKYGKYSPSMRKAIAGYTPFLAWYRNAAEFLFKVLPRDHPVLTSLAASAMQASQEWRRQHGLVATLGQPNQGQKPQWLQGSIPGKGDTNLRISRYTPFGIQQDKFGLLGSIANTVLPQVMSAVQNAQGQDWKGESLGGFHQDSTQAKNALAAAVTLAEGVIPLASQGVRLAGVQPPNEAPGKNIPPTLSARVQKELLPFEFSGPSSGGSSSPTPTFNLGKATAGVLETINGVGPKTAGSVTRYRKSHGGKLPRDLTRIPGVGPATAAKIQRATGHGPSPAPKGQSPALGKLLQAVNQASKP